MQPAEVVQRRSDREDALCRVPGRRNGRMPSTVALLIRDVFTAFSPTTIPALRHPSQFLPKSPSVSPCVCRMSRCVCVVIAVDIYFD